MATPKWTTKHLYLCAAREKSMHICILIGKWMRYEGTSFLQNSTKNVIPLNDFSFSNWHQRRFLNTRQKHFHLILFYIVNIISVLWVKLLNEVDFELKNFGEIFWLCAHFANVLCVKCVSVNVGDSDDDDDGKIVCMHQWSFCVWTICMLFLLLKRQQRTIIPTTQNHFKIYL